MQKNKEKTIAQAMGKAIAQKRMEKGLTQENVAEKLNIGYEAVSRIERGTVIPNIVRLVELADIFECGIDELLIALSRRPINHANALLKRLEQLAEPDRELLLNVMTTLADRLAKGDKQ
ncbi:helix-turn-helix domain-containing protein [Oxalobacter paraformigenes]|uniref:HTH cro/C1-type domain-containing protein n=1 Tax=Oxalobacter paraformigenes TaxID=556268 RepID=C3X4W7_9BURK|nr:helix-turn-helix transcriptional regulator [Oxalobacter paraformigenes]EEO28253.1 hypothetical protein OFAG_01406 [Oxalobacter paraformigenes]